MNCAAKLIFTNFLRLGFWIISMVGRPIDYIWRLARLGDGYGVRSFCHHYHAVYKQRGNRNLINTNSCFNGNFLKL